MLKPVRQITASYVELKRGLRVRLTDWMSAGRCPGYLKYVVAAVVAAGLGGWAALRSNATDEMAPARLMPTPKRNFAGLVHGFSAEELKIALPVIRLNGCLFAEAAVRYALRPASVGFQSCGDPVNFTISISDDLKEMSVSGIADVGLQRKPFTVVMQHYPSSLGIDGLLIEAIRIEPGVARPAAAK